MSGTEEQSATSRARYVCRSCKHPVNAVLERHKTMGVYVPTWTAGPCHNEKCSEYVPEQVAVTSIRGETWRTLTGWRRG
ncbi:hypothetical protein KYY02_16295 [Streptomyces pimonensis]|uniref:Uncharacterized protein n=1 Tax=Streptomyces pimonensis TaxID=2860288 RepID=A0ABV4IZT4_9ACTN